jgi:hypothetical protein
MALRSGAAAGSDARAVAKELRRLETLWRNLQQLASTGGTAREDWQGAPLPEHWTLRSRPIPCRVGHIDGHPLLGGPVVRASPLWGGDLDAGCARTERIIYTIRRRAFYGAHPEADE